MEAQDILEIRDRVLPELADELDDEEVLKIFSDVQAGVSVRAISRKYKPEDPGDANFVLIEVVIDAAEFALAIAKTYAVLKELSDTELAQDLKSLIYKNWNESYREKFDAYVDEIIREVKRFLDH